MKMAFSDISILLNKVRGQNKWQDQDGK